jgi:hypothetical protein
MTTKHMLASVSLVAVVAALAAPAAGATPDGYVVRSGSALAAKSTIEWRGEPSRIQARVPDGYQPQLNTSDGAAGAPDNLARDVPRGTSPFVAPEPSVSNRGFDWNDAFVGFVAALLIATLAVSLTAFAVRGRSLARA